MAAKGKSKKGKSKGNSFGGKQAAPFGSKSDKKKAPARKGKK